MTIWEDIPAELIMEPITKIIGDVGQGPMWYVVMVNNKPDTRRTWDDHEINGHYLETSREHYWFYKIWIKQTRSIGVADTTYFKHQYIIMPTYTKMDATDTALNKLIWILQKETPQNIGQTGKEKLTTLANIFNMAATKWPTRKQIKAVSVTTQTSYNWWWRQRKW